MTDLTAAQLWALKSLRDQGPMSMADLGQQMRNRPGAQSGKKNYARDRQGLGMVGSLMVSRLEKLRFVERTFDYGSHRVRLTPMGRTALKEHGYAV